MSSLWQIAYVIVLAVLVYGFIRSLQEYHRQRNLLLILLSSVLLIVITELWVQAYGLRFKSLFEQYRLLLLFLPLGVFLAYQYWEEKHHAGEKERARIRAMFERYLSPAVISKLLEKDFSLGGRRQEVTVLVTDLRESTKMCLQHPPEIIVKTLNEYFETVNSTLIENGGMIDKITGDGVMALFNTPLAQKNHTLKAVQTSVELQKRVKELNARLRKKHLPHLRMGIGIDLGEGVVGNIGSHQLARYTVIGDVANTAARIQLYANEGEIVLTEKAYWLVKNAFRAKGPYTVSLKGKGPTKIYKVVVF